MSDIEDSVSEKLRRYMDKRGVSARSLSASAKLNETAVRDILIGRSKAPRLSTVMRIAQALEIDPRDLLSPRDMQRLEKENPGIQYRGFTRGELIGSSIDDLPDMGKIVGTDFTSSNLTGATLQYSDLKGSNFSNAILTKANFYSCNLRFCNFTNAVVDATVFVDADLRDADFTGVDLSKAILR